MKESNLKSNFIYNLIYQALILIVPLITSPYLTRVIGAEGLGIYSFSQSFAFYFVLFIMLGVNNYGNREIARVRNNSLRVNRTFTEIYFIQFTLMIIFSIFYLAVIFLYIKENKLIYSIQFLYVISAGFDVNWCCFGLEKFKLTVTRNSIIKISSAILIFLFVKDKNDLAVYTIINAGSIFVSQLVIWPFILKDVKFIAVKKKDVFHRFKPLIVLFIPVVAVSLYTVLAKLLLGMLSSKTEVAFFTYAERLTQIPLAFISAIGTVMLPRSSHLISQGMDKENKDLINKSMQLSMFIASSCCFVLIGIANQLIPWFYGDSFSKSIILTILLSPTIFFISWNNVIRTQFIIPKGYDRIYIITVSIGAIANIILNLILIPRFAGVGAAIATVVANFFVCLCQYLLVKKYFEFKNYFIDGMSFAFIGFVMSIILYKLPNISSELGTIILKIIIGASFFIVVSLLYLVKIRKDYYFLTVLKSSIKKFTFSN
ncbi:TPA: flippase [Streptococcus suis]